MLTRDRNKVKFSRSLLRNCQSSLLKPQPYAREAEWGTLIKLYEYSLPGHRTHILRKSGLLARLELLLPELALPIRLYECRPGYGGHAGSYETTLTGLGVRLDEGGRAENLETDFPVSVEMTCAGEPMTATIFAFKKGRAETYRKSEGIIFAVNGQTHGYLTIDFFRALKKSGFHTLRIRYW